MFRVYGPCTVVKVPSEALAPLEPELLMLVSRYVGAEKPLQEQQELLVVEPSLQLSEP